MKCKIPNCDNPVWNNKYGYCKLHLYLSEEYRNRRLEQRSQRKRYKVPPVSKKRLNELKTYSQKDMFKEIWDDMPRPRVCPVSGRVLDDFEGKDNFHWLFAHILPKGKYPKAKMDKENIAVVHPEVHTLFDQGTQEQRDKYDWNWDYLYKRREELKNKYK